MKNNPVKFKAKLPACGAQPPLSLCSWKKERCYYINDALVTPGSLVVYIPVRHLVNYKTQQVQLPTRREGPIWRRIEHQTAGYACHHIEMYARFLQPRKNIIKLIDELNTTYLDSNIHQPPSLKTANEYQSLLTKYKLTANHSYHLLEEAFYPIDIECLNRVTYEKLPDNLNDLFRSTRRQDSFTSIFGHQFCLAILGENCD